jgi:hypothetical protein
MKRNSSINSSTKTVTTDATLEARFDAGEDVLGYFDTAKAQVTHGGTRLGAGRKATGKLRKTVKLSPQAVRRFEK